MWGPVPKIHRMWLLYSRDQLAILDAKPGMTSPASLQHRDEEAHLVGPDWKDRYVHELMPTKIAIDRAYLSRRTVWSDIRVILATVLGAWTYKSSVNDCDEGMS